VSTVHLALWLALGCQPGPDADLDGVPDACEMELARRFAPVLAVSPRACNWDADAELLVGGYLFGVAPIEGGFRVLYLPAYAQDCGWSGPKCLLRWRGGCDPHPADSEFLAVDVSEVGGELKASRVFLSAHCFGRSQDDCRWHDAAELEWMGDAPLVWVAEGKNANYGSRSACDAGHWGFDTCDRNSRAVRFPALAAGHNIGSWQVPFPEHLADRPCVRAEELATAGLGSGSECIWTDEEFRGWHARDTPGVTGYARYLREVAEFAPPAGPS